MQTTQRPNFFRTYMSDDRTFLHVSRKQAPTVTFNVPSEVMTT